VHGKSYTVDRSNKHADAILKALQTGASEEQLVKLFDVATTIVEYLSGEVSIKNGTVFYRNMPISNVVARRILEFMEQKLDYKPLVLFLENIMRNPSRNSVEQLYNFLEKEGLPITSDGCFIAYKGVTPDGWSVSSGPKHVVEVGIVNDNGQIRNHVGDSVIMSRNFVCDNPDIHCSHGLHAGSHEYASGFGSKVVLVKINPANCVSVPNDHDCQKLRVCAYHVIAESQGLIRNKLVTKTDDLYTGDQGPAGEEGRDTDGDVNGLTEPLIVQSYTYNGDEVCTYEDLTVDEARKLVSDVINKAGLDYEAYNQYDREVTSKLAELIDG
jgi:hypothetical protein